MTATLPDRLTAISVPWPDLTGVQAWNYTIGGYGRHLVEDAIRALPFDAQMLEIGCFLGASARRWLSVRGDLTVIGVDPWGGDLVETCQRYVGRPAIARTYPERETQERFAADVARQGPLKTALANLIDFKDRFIPIQGLSPQILPRLKRAGAEPSLIYIDATKSPEDLDVCHALWPEAQLTGDDWHWSRTKGYPMRVIVNSFAERHGYRVTAESATWVLNKA